MKTNNMSTQFNIISEEINLLYTETINNLHKLEKIHKSGFKKLQKKSSKDMTTLHTKNKFFGKEHNCKLTTIFLFESLNILDNEYDSINIWIEYLSDIDLGYVLKDKNFYIFLKNIIFTQNMYKVNKTNYNFDNNTEYLKNMRLYFGDIRSILLSYFIINEQNITKNTIVNITSYILRKSNVKGISSCNENQTILLNQIITGIKYEKTKDSVNTTDTRAYIKSKKFNIINNLKQTIKIKYLSKQDFKHRFHKSPIEHERIGHYRHYKNGNKVWINKSIINIGKAS